MVELRVGEQLVFDDVVAVVSSRDVLRVRGVDAASYLHGQISQDVEGLAIAASAWTLLLQPQGKVDAWLRIHRRGGEEFWLDVEPGYGQAAKDRLERFKLRVAAEIDLFTVPIVALRGPASARAAAEVTAPLVVLDGGWGGIDGADLFDPGLLESDGPPADPVSWIPDGVARAGEELLDVVRIRQGRPAMGHELDESTIPASAGIVERSVDFTKGCYVGQELVARIDSRGNNTPTRLYGLRFGGPDVPAVGAELSLDGVPSGTVTSVTVSPGLGTIGLAYLKRVVEVPASLQALSPDGRTQPVEAVELPLTVG
ncbi:MAG: YgfZ/GcvT domain-containing protein [Acidimicrobiales bacterium]